MVEREAFPGREEKRPAVVCLGFFDGVHRGHLELIRTARQVADARGLSVCVHTYDRAPLGVIHPGAEVPELTDPEEKHRLLRLAGADMVAVSPFDRDLMAMPGEEFFLKVLLGRLGARYLVTGFNHRFGYRGQTDAAELLRLCQAHGIGLSVVPPVLNSRGEVISSTAIRNAIRAGNIALAEEMLGRPCDGPMLERMRKMSVPTRDEQNNTEVI